MAGGCSAFKELPQCFAKHWRCFVLCWDVWRVKAPDPCVLTAVACPHGFGASFLPGVDFLPDEGLFILSACFLAGWLWFPSLLSSEISCVSCAKPLSDSGLQTPSSQAVTCPLRPWRTLSGQLHAHVLWRLPLVSTGVIVVSEGRVLA